MHVFEQHGAVEASVACRFVLRRRSAIGCGSSDACVRAASSSGSVCCLQVRAETKKRKAPAPVIPRALPLLQPGSADRSRRAALARAIQAAHAVRRSAESPSEGGRTRLPPAASLKRSDEAFHLLGIHEVILLCQTYTAQTTAKQKTENLPASGDIGDVKKQHTVSQILVIRQIKETRMMECLTSLDL